MSSLRTRRWVLAAVAVVAMMAAPAPATVAAATPTGVAPTVIGSGWTEVHPGKTIQVVSGGVNYPRNWATTTYAAEPGAMYDRTAGIETFRLLSNRSNRVEVRVHNDYRTGRRQFEGELRVYAPTNDESCMQIFGNDGPGATTLMIRAFAADNGTLRGAGKVLATNVFGRWVKINVVHDGTANRFQIYIDGVLKADSAGPPGDHYFKYGLYGTLTTPNALNQWRNVRYFQK